MNPDLQRALAQHLGTVAPAVAAVIWLLRRTRRYDRSKGKKEEIEEDEGQIVEVEIPSSSKRQQPGSINIPPALKLPLLELEIPVSLATFWSATFSGDKDNLLMKLHDDLKDKNTTFYPWKQQQKSAPRRVLQFITPLHNPLGPKQAANTEIFTAQQVGSDGFVVNAVCTSQGVPFANCFENHVQWVGLPAATGNTCRLIITGECRFTGNIWGPIKGKIDNESKKGMTKAYDMFGKLIADKFGMERQVDAAVKKEFWLIEPRLLPLAVVLAAVAVHYFYYYSGVLRNYWL